MPLLDKNDLKTMRDWEDICLACGKPLRKNYCRECDEFFIIGHAKGCRREDKEHDDHRTY